MPQPKVSNALTGYCDADVLVLRLFDPALLYAFDQGLAFVEIGEHVFVGIQWELDTLPA